MFSKPIFKQSLRANWKLWAIITAVGAAMLSIFMVSFDPESTKSLAIASQGTRFSSVLSGMTTLLGTAESFFKMLAILLGIVYVLITANNLVVKEVDSGSMAYTLSTPIKRSSVIFTKMVYLISSVILMFGIIGGVGLGIAEVKYHNVTGYAITADVEQAAKSLNKSERYVADHLYLIKDDQEALKEAAKARKMDTVAYNQYLDGLIRDRSYKAAADVLTKERRDDHGGDWSESKIEITVSEAKKDPKLILDSSDALEAGADAKGVSLAEYRSYLADEIKASKEKTASPSNPNASLILQTAKSAAAQALDIKEARINDNMSLMKDATALDAASKATNLPVEEISKMVDASMIASAQSVDSALDFDTEAYIWLVVGITLLILAMGSISFFASTFFNSTGAAMALGGGLPFAFFLISMIRQQVDNMENLKYFTLTTLYDTKEILAGGDFGWGLLALAGISLVLYGASNIIFTKKDLPL